VSATNRTTASNMNVIRFATSTILMKPYILQRPEGGRRCRWRNPCEGDLRHGTGLVSSKTLFCHPGVGGNRRGQGQIGGTPLSGVAASVGPRCVASDFPIESRTMIRLVGVWI